MSFRSVGRRFHARGAATENARSPSRRSVLGWKRSPLLEARMHGDKIAPMINNSVGGANETGKIFQEKRAIVIDSAEVVFTVACHYRRIVYNVGHVLSSWCFCSLSQIH